MIGRRSRPALGAAPAEEVLAATLGRLVPGKLSGLAAVAADDSGTHTWSAGAADVGAAFQIGSVTKVFTALLLAVAAADGDVALDAPAVEGLRVGGRPVTFRDLVTHRSGLPRVPEGSDRGADMSDPYHGWDETRLRAATAAATDRTKPGRDAPIVYSNFGFAVLGVALADALGVPWEQALRDRVLLPAGLTATSVVPAARRALASPDARPWDLAAFAPAGGLWMSVADLRTWLLLLVEAVGSAADGPVVDAVRTTLVPQARTPLAHVGMAWHFLDRGHVAWHNGGVLGACSFVGLDLQHARAIGVLALGNPTNALDKAATRALTGR